MLIDGIEIDGFILEIDDGLNGEFSIVYDGSKDYSTKQYSAVGLNTGLPYRFRLYSINVNGRSEASDEVTIYACLKPEKN